MKKNKMVTVPIHVVNDHNEVFKHWLGLKDASLLHIDRHCDSFSEFIDADLDHTTEEHSNEKLSIGNFICAAVYHKMVSKFCWYDPHEEELVEFYTGNNKLKAKAQEENEGRIIVWGAENEWSVPYNKPITLDKALNSDAPYILDIDLDAFACVNHGLVWESNYLQVYGWKRRLEETVELLEAVERVPDVITIARSQGFWEEGFGTRWVPENLVDHVQKETILKLRELYK